MLTNYSAYCRISKFDAQLQSTDLVTIFAPTDAAFAKAAGGVPLNNSAELLDLLQFHAAFGDILSTALKPSQEIQTLMGPKVLITRNVTSGTIHIQSATILQADLTASNGVLHIINEVLHPPVAPSPVPAPSPSQPTPGPPTPAARTSWYDCSFPAFQCVLVPSKGTYNSSVACKRACVAPTPKPTPPPTPKPTPKPTPPPPPPPAPARRRRRRRIFGGRH
jgi:hypothetical protein